MERLINCNIVVVIEKIEKISGGNQFFEIYFETPNKTKYKIIFDFVWDIRSSIENAYIERASKFFHAEREKSSILMIENSNYIKYFEEQVSGTRPVKEIKDYIISDSVDTVIEVLTINEPVLVKI